MFPKPWQDVCIQIGAAPHSLNRYRIEVDSLRPFRYFAVTVESRSHIIIKHNW